MVYSVNTMWKFCNFLGKILDKLAELTWHYRNSPIIIAQPRLLHCAYFMTAVYYQYTIGILHVSEVKVIIEELIFVLIARGYYIS